MAGFGRRVNPTTELMGLHPLCVYNPLVATSPFRPGGYINSHYVIFVCTD
jgi:hypothetical protein